VKNQSSSKISVKDIDENAVLLQAFFNITPQYQVLLNTRLEIVAFNKCACDFHHTYSRSNIRKGASILNYIDDSLAEDFRAQCLQALSGDIVHYEHFIQGGWFNFAMEPLIDTDNVIAGLAIVGHNINQEKKNAKLIREQSERLSFIAQLQSHQVRHPVSSILGLINLIKEEENYHLTREYIEKLEKATQQLDDIIKAIVSQSRKV
jgi:signal transduction histidine kinase